MTQPIQEPGQTTRTDAKLTWGSNQLFRRPAPAQGESELPLPIAAWRATGIGQQEIPGSILGRYLYFEDETDTNFAWTTDSASVSFYTSADRTVDTITGTEPATGLTLHLVGLWAVQLNHSWQTQPGPAAAGAGTYYANVMTDYFGLEGFFYIGEKNYFPDRVYHINMETNCIFVFINSEPINILAKAYQTTPDTLLFSSAELRVHYLGFFELVG